MISGQPDNYYSFFWFDSFIAEPYLQNIFCLFGFGLFPNTTHSFKLKSFCSSIQIQHMYDNYGQKHNCNDCMLTFETPHELQNHKRRFCINSGYDNLQGLAKIQYQGIEPMHKPTFSNKNHLQNYGMNSLTKIGVQDQLTSSNLERDMKNINKFKRQLQGVKKYKHNEQYESSLKESNRKLDRTQISKNSYTQSRIDQDLKKYQKPVEEAISPPTFIDQLNMRNRTVLDKSNSTIARMPNKDKIQYAKTKLDQLEGIKDLYIQNGGSKPEFRDNIDKMVDFYSKFLENQTKKQKQEEQKGFNDSQLLIQSRCSTPILKLRDFNQEGANRSTKKSQAKKEMSNSNAKNNQTANPSFPPFGFPATIPQNGQGYYYSQPPIVMVPYPPPQNQGQNDSMRVLQKMIELKSEQNKKLLQILLEDKKKGSQSMPTFIPYQLPTAQSPLFPQTNTVNQNPSLRTKTNKKGQIDVQQDYQFKKSMVADLISEQKVLLALQQQQLDQLKLLSQLPKQLQEIKMNSAIKASDMRFQIQKQILKQKMARLAYQQQNQTFEEKRKLENDRWAGEERKKLLEKQLDRYVQNFQKQFVEDDDE